MAFARAAAVPLAWRNLVASKPRLLRSAGGIGFAVLLMLMQLGFEAAFFNASLIIVRRIDGDLIVQKASKYRFVTSDPFPARDLDAARRVTGVASVRPLSADWTDLFWKNPTNGRLFLVRAFAFDPNQPVFDFPEVNAQRTRLEAPDTVLVDRRARRLLGMDSGAKESEINGVKVRIVGSFALGPDFQSDGTVMMSEGTFARLLHGAAGNPPAIEAGVVRLAAGANPQAVAAALRKVLPPGLAVMTKARLVAFERDFQAKVSSAGPIFAMGTLVGFVVGMLIAYQITYTDLSDQLPQYATLKAMGYRTPYLMRVVLEQAAMNAVAGWLPAWLLGIGLFYVVGEVALLPLRMSLGLTLVSLALTVTMCLISAAVALRRVVVADPAEVF